MLPKNEGLKKLLKHKTITPQLKERLETKKRIYREKLGLIEQILSKKVEDVKRAPEPVSEGTV